MEFFQAQSPNQKFTAAIKGDFVWWHAPFEPMSKPYGHTFKCVGRTLSLYLPSPHNQDALKAELSSLPFRKFQPKPPNEFSHPNHLIYQYRDTTIQMTCSKWGSNFCISQRFNKDSDMLNPDLGRETHASLVWINAYLQNQSLEFTLQTHLDEHHDYHGSPPSMTFQFPESQTVLDLLLQGKENGSFWTWASSWISWRYCE